ncbi:hypothetical protein LINPERPRIM_LOCUS23839 [Linum perenne]
MRQHMMPDPLLLYCGHKWHHPSLPSIDNLKSLNLSSSPHFDSSVHHSSAVDSIHRILSSPSREETEMGTEPDAA